MQKQPPTLGRLIILAGFALSCFGLLLYLWLAFGGTIPLAAKGYRINIDFPQAAQLATQSDVRISGVNVGKVLSLDQGPGNTTRATIQLDKQYAPIPRNTRATLRFKTLLGQTYVALSPGDPAKGALADNGTLPRGQISEQVQLDQVLSTFDPRTRAAVRDWMQGAAEAVDGRGQDLSNIIGNLQPFSQQTNRLLTILNSQTNAVRRLVRNTGDVAGALTARGDQLAALIRSSNSVFHTTAQRNADLQALFAVLPTFQTEATTTLNTLTEFASNTEPLVQQLQPAAAQLTPTLQDLARLSPDLRALFVDLNSLFDVSKKGLPATNRVLSSLHPVLAQLDPFLRNVNPILDYLGLYKREIVTFFANSAASTQAVSKGTDGKLYHYLRTTNPLSPEVLAAYPERTGTDRPNPYMLPGGFDNLAKGLQVYENRQCGRPDVKIPTLAPIGTKPPPSTPPLTNAEDPEDSLIARYVFGRFAWDDFDANTGKVLKNIPAPACSLQPDFPAPFGTRFPQLKEAPAK